MAQLSIKTIVRGGVQPDEANYPAAASGGDQCDNPGTVFLHVVNGDTASHDVQVDGKVTKFGKDIDPDPVTVPAGEERLLGPFPREDFGSTLEWTYPTGVTAVSVQPYKLSNVTPS